MADTVPTSNPNPPPNVSVVTVDGVTMFGNGTSDSPLRAAPPAATGQYLATSYGVVANGVTDDRAALNNAIAAVNNAGGGELLLPDGPMRATQDGANDWCVRLLAGVTLVGQGPRTSIVKDATLAATPNKSVATVKIEGDNTCMRNLTVNGNTPIVGYNPQYEHQSGIFINAHNDVILDNVETFGNSGDGIQLYLGCQRVRGFDFSVHDNGRQGMSFTAGSSAAPELDIRMVGCRFYNNYLNQIDSEPGGTGFDGYVSFVGCTIDIGTKLNHAVTVFGSKNWTFAGCSIRGTVEIALSSGITMTGCNVEDPTEGSGCVFIYEQNSGIVLSGNYFKPTHSVSGVYAVRIEGLATTGQKAANVVLADNVIDCSAAPADINGVSARSSLSLLAEGNILIGPGLASASGDGFHLRATDTAEDTRSLQVNNNRISNFGKYGIAVYGNGTAKVDYLQANNNLFDNTAGTMTVGINLNADATGALQGLDVCNNRMQGGVTTPLLNAPAGTATLVPGTTNNTGWLSK